MCVCVIERERERERTIVTSVASLSPNSSDVSSTVISLIHFRTLKSDPATLVLRDVADCYAHGTRRTADFFREFRQR